MNLPTDVNNLVFGPILSNNFLEGCFVNLPTSIKNITFNCDRKIEDLRLLGYFNFLFGPKLPFGCNMYVSLTNENTIYKVINENNSKEELILETQGHKIDINYNYIYVMPELFKGLQNCDFQDYDFQYYNVLRIMSSIGDLGFSK